MVWKLLPRAIYISDVLLSRLICEQFAASDLASNLSARDIVDFVVNRRNETKVVPCTLHSPEQISILLRDDADRASISKYNFESEEQFAHRPVLALQDTVSAA